MNLLTIIAVASGGAIGATLRLLISTVVNKTVVHTLPFGTLAVNLLGSLMIGLLFAYFHLNTSLSPHLKTFFITSLYCLFCNIAPFAQA